jgi:hypothetical protein
MVLHRPEHFKERETATEPTPTGDPWTLAGSPQRQGFLEQFGNFSLTRCDRGKFDQPLLSQCSRHQSGQV